jgi:hypothetical protein
MVDADARSQDISIWKRGLACYQSIGSCAQGRWRSMG